MLQSPEVLQPPTARQEFPTKKAVAVMGAILTVTCAMWLVAGLSYTDFVHQGMALLVVAYTLGLRHALDADHIAAIDNVTRRLVMNGQKPVAVGLFFSLGHSTIVLITTMLLAALSSTIMDKFDGYGHASALIGPSISAGFLFLIGTINGVSAFMIARNLKDLKNRASDDKVDWDEILEKSGFFSRVFGKRLFRIINAPYKMYFVGFLFGLGFDTASEVALLGIVALQALRGSEVWLILFLPILFTCGMTLIDTADGILMLGAYGWASVTPMKKLYYNLAVTIIACIFAFFVAAIEFLSIFETIWDLKEPFWDAIRATSDDNHFQSIGIALLASFLLGWLLSRILCRYYSITENDLSPQNGPEQNNENNFLAESTCSSRTGKSTIDSSRDNSPHSGTDRGPDSERIPNENSCENSDENVHENSQEMVEGGTHETNHDIILTVADETDPPLDDIPVDHTREVVIGIDTIPACAPESAQFSL